MIRFHQHSWAGARVAVAAALCFAGGCVAAEPPLNPVVAAMIGKEAKLVARGVPPLTWRASSGGNLAVMDLTTGGFPLATCSMRNPGQLLSIDPQEATIVLKSATDAERFDSLASDIDPSHEFGIYFTAIKAPPSQSVPKRPGP